MTVNTLKTSRRSFLKGAAAIAGFPTIISSAALGRSEIPPSEKINLGIIGTGGQGRYHMGNYNRFQDQARVVAICDVNAANVQKAREELAKMYGKDEVACFGDFRELLARPDIDAVSIAVPDHWHALIAVSAAKAGKHVYCEKPLAYSIAEGKAIVDTVKKCGVVFQHGTQQRSGAQYRLACELALNGRLGKLTTIRVGSPNGLRGGSVEVAPVPEGLDYEMWLGPAPYHDFTPGRCDGSSGHGWYQIRDYSGGWITAWGAHDVDIAQWGNGADKSGPIEVEAVAEYPTTGAYNTAWKWHAECRYANGVTVIYASADENPHGIRFQGDKGWVFLNREEIRADPESLLKEQFGEGDIRVPVSDDHYLNFLECIRTHATPVASVDIAHRTTTACHLVNIALARGGKVRWNPETESIVGDPEAGKLLSRTMRAPWSLS